jgi:siroheme synthase-like protein
VKTYPVFLIGLERRRSIVIGPGAEAERKIDGLLDCGAAVTVIAPESTPHVRELARRGRLTWLERDYAEGDLAGAFLVIATGDDPARNERIFREAQERGVLINVMDDTAHCTFIAGSVVRRGPLTVAISTGGSAPALAVRLRERLERELGAEYGDFLGLMSSLREPLARRYPEFATRRRLWYRLVDSDLLEQLRAGDPARARARAEQLIDEFERRA